MQVVILAGWLWTRISEETSLVPKPMVLIGGKPILRHIMKMYSAQWFNEFIICLWYKSNIIKDFFLNYYMHNSNITVDLEHNSTHIHNTTSEKWKVTLVETGYHTMTWWRIKKIIPYLNNDNFLLTYGDGVSDVNFSELLKFHNTHGKLATITAIQPEWRFWKLWLEGNLIKEFAEKKDHSDTYINGGFMILHKSIIEYITSDDMPLEKDPLENLAKDWELMAYKHTWFWYAMDTLQNKNHLENLRNTNQAPWKNR